MVDHHLSPFAVPAAPVVAIGPTPDGPAFRVSVPPADPPRPSPRLAPSPRIAPDRESAPVPSAPGSGARLTWEPGVARVIRDMVEARARKPGGQRPPPFLVALVGIPGSGKSTSSSILSDLLTRPLGGADGGGSGGGGIPNAVMPMDGYHHPLSRLLSFPDPADAIYRRGAPDTFDAGALLRDLRRIRSGSESVVRVPGFDHARGDPEPERHAFSREDHRAVICEGLYLLHDADGWEEVAEQFDLRVFIHSDVDVCVNRLKVRNKCIPGYTPEEIDVRCDVVDRANAYTVLRSRDRADLVVESAA